MPLKAVRYKLGGKALIPVSVFGPICPSTVTEPCLSILQAICAASETDIMHGLTEQSNKALATCWSFTASNCNDVQ